MLMLGCIDREWRDGCWGWGGGGGWRHSLPPALGVTALQSPTQLLAAQGRVRPGVPPARRDGEGGWDSPKGAAGLNFTAEVRLGAPSNHG